MAKPTLRKLKKEIEELESTPKITRADIQKQLDKGKDIGDYLDQKGVSEEYKRKVISDLNSYATK